MIPIKFISLAVLLYIGLLFGVAYVADWRRDAGRSVVANSWVYSLSMAVHYTSWTFYGLVGQAATTGIAFLAPYLGATLIAFTWWFLLRKMVRICKEHPQHRRLHREPLRQITTPRRDRHHLFHHGDYSLYRPATQGSGTHL